MLQPRDFYITGFNIFCFIKHDVFHIQNNYKEKCYGYLSLEDVACQLPVSTTSGIINNYQEKSNGYIFFRGCCIPPNCKYYQWYMCQPVEKHKTYTIDNYQQNYITEESPFESSKVK